MPNQIEVTVVVSGQGVPVKANTHQPVQELVRHALNESGNQGQDPNEWVLKAGAGPIDQSQTVGEAGIANGQTLYLSPKVSEGGGY
jgi:hypothetical protein